MCGIEKQRLELETQQRLDECKADVDRRLETRLKQVERERAKFSEELQSRMQALNLDPADQDLLAQNLNEARKEKENKQVQLEEIVSPLA